MEKKAGLRVVDNSDQTLATTAADLALINFVRALARDAAREEYFSMNVSDGDETEANRIVRPLFE